MAGGGEDDPVCLAGARDNEEMESSRAWHRTNYHHSTVSPVPLFLFPSFSVFSFSSFICTPPTKYPVPLFPPLLFIQFFFCFSSSSWPTIYSSPSFLSFQSGKPLYKNCVCLGVAQITFNPPLPIVLQALCHKPSWLDFDPLKVKKRTAKKVCNKTSSLPIYIDDLCIYHWLFVLISLSIISIERRVQQFSTKKHSFEPVFINTSIIVSPKMPS